MVKMRKIEKGCYSKKGGSYLFKKKKKREADGSKIYAVLLQ